MVAELMKAFRGKCDHCKYLQLYSELNIKRCSENINGQVSLVCLEKVGTFYCIKIHDSYAYESE